MKRGPVIHGRHLEGARCQTPGVAQVGHAPNLPSGGGKGGLSKPVVDATDPVVGPYPKCSSIGEAGDSARGPSERVDRPAGRNGAPCARAKRSPYGLWIVRRRGRVDPGNPVVDIAACN